MPISAYLTIKGQKQGAFNGPVTDTGKTGAIQVHSFDNEISVPLDPATGAVTGKRQHNPIRILKEIDATSPRFWAALVNNEALTTWELDLWETGPTGLATKIYTISLINASVVSVEQSLLDDETPPGTMSQEEISFTYQKITWTWVNGGVTASDNWTATV